MMPAPSFGAVLRAARIDRGLTPSDLAARSKADKSSITRMERDERHPTREMVLRLARGLDADRAEIDRLLVAAGYLPSISGLASVLAEHLNG
jgi:transcriptional regulator with XRE-family HTH domain